MNKYKITWLGNRTWNAEKYNISRPDITKAPLNNPFDLHPNAQKAWFYNIFWGVGKNDTYFYGKTNIKLEKIMLKIPKLFELVN